jgi:xylulokinase
VTAERYVLAIDMGSGSVKAALVSRQGEVIASANREIHTRYLPGGGAEQDPHEWWAAVVEAARATLQQAGMTPACVVAIKCVTQWSVTVAVGADGNALGDAISWMDSRGGPYNRRLVDGPLKLSGYDVFKLRRWIKLTGGCPVQSGIDSLGHILFLKHERPDVYARAHKFIEPMDYLNLRLTGRIVASYGTIFPYWLTDNRDAGRIDYAPSLLALAGIERAKLPDLVSVDAVVGTLTPAAADALGLLPTTQVLAGACDSQAAAIGAGATRDHDGYFYIGSTSWMSCHVRAKKTDLLHSILTMPAALPGRYIVVAEQGMAGRCLEFLKDNILFPGGENGAALASDPYDILNLEAGKVPPGSEGLIFTPWINGVLVPSEDRYTRSAFMNQSARTTRSHYVRAVMEGVAFNLRWLRHHVERFVGRPFAQLNFIGGAALSPVWCQILADVLGCPVRQVANPRYANAVGGALAAFGALGDMTIEDMASTVKFAAVYQPDAGNRRVYDQQFSAFMQFYKRMKPVYRRLNAAAGPV